MKFDSLAEVVLRPSSRNSPADWARFECQSCGWHTILPVSDDIPSWTLTHVALLEPLYAGHRAIPHMFEEEA